MVYVLGGASLLVTLGFLAAAGAADEAEDCIALWMASALGLIVTVFILTWSP